MKKNKILSLLSLLLLALAVAPASAQTTKDILAKMIDAQGGAKLMESLKDMTMSGSMEIVMVGMQGGMTIYQKEPNKIRMEIEISGTQMTMAFDGEKGWMTNPQTGGNIEEMPENQLKQIKQQAMGTVSLLHPEKLGITYEYKGKEKIKDKDYLLLVQTMSNGYKTTMYIDPETYLTYKTKSRALNAMTGVEADAEQIMSDYRKVNGTMVAHSMTTISDGQEYMRMSISKVTYNSNLEDSFFKLGK